MAHLEHLEVTSCKHERFTPGTSFKVVYAGVDSVQSQSTLTLPVIQPSQQTRPLSWPQDHF